MLRTLLAALVVANLLFFAFTRGWFDGIGGVNSLGDREPERLAAQVRPEAVRLSPMAPASAAAGAACYEAGPFTAAEMAALDETLRAALPAGAWTDIRSDAAGPAGTLVASHLVRIADAEPSLVARLATLRLEPGGRSFAPCRLERR